MPQIYRRHSEYHPLPPMRRQTIQPTDADDSIVLSDLVRTGEASRLRRRGAMRLDHNSARSVILPSLPSTSAPSRPIVMTPSRPSTPPWGNPDLQGDDEYTYGGGEWRDWNTDDTELQADDIRREGVAAYADAEEAVMLFCGGEMKAVEEDMPFVPSPTPTFPRKSSSSRSPVRKTNGCGAVVHMQAFPQRPRGVYVGKEDATPAVVGLESSYFESSVVAKMMKSACGCIREGIGCAVW